MGKRNVLENTPMPGIVLTFPIVAGKVEAWRRFCQELSGSRRQMYEASRQRLGITRERLVLVETAFGSAAVTTLEAPMWTGYWVRSSLGWLHHTPVRI